MNDYAYLNGMSKGVPTIITYGTSDADITGEVINNHAEFLGVTITKGMCMTSIETKLVGDYNLPNVLAAIAIGNYFKVPEEKIQTALENYTPSNSRSQLIEKDSNKIILDAYNANPSSMNAAIDNFAKMEGNDKVLLLGGMMELGEESVEEHKALLDMIANYEWKVVVLVGGDFSKIKNPYINFTTSTEAKEWFHQQHFKDATILIKGSRSVQMEKVLE
jgi:UDP-N-acetylmuramoyl-tripeptide--D-alanyl-D-alanine ligase